MRTGFLRLLVVCLLAAPLTAQLPFESKLDHYKFWAVSRLDVAGVVGLHGQFDGDGWWSASLDSIQLLGNPTNKTHGTTVVKINNPDLHLLAYSLQRVRHRQPQREVRIVNQFTTPRLGEFERWTIGAPKFLLVPAGKEFAPADAQKPDRGDHFVCYIAIRPARFDVDVKLQDQFDLKYGKDETITALQPAFFCVPVQKRYGKEQAQPLLDEKTHLAIYRIFPQQKLQYRVHTADQFGTHRLRSIESTWLAVPTAKVDWR